MKNAKLVLPPFQPTQQTASVFSDVDIYPLPINFILVLDILWIATLKNTNIWTIG